MMPAARVEAAIELLDLIVESAREAGPAADVLISRYFKARRYAGSADRRAVRDLVYRVVRAMGERPSSGRAALIGFARHAEPTLLDLFGSGPHAPPPLDPDEPGAEVGVVPAWLLEKLQGRFRDEAHEEALALLERAPLDLRVNLLKGDVDSLLAAVPGLQRLPNTPCGVRAGGNLQIETHEAYREGRVEIQDAGSQIVSAACGARPGMTVVDLCAGAGGKTLAVASAMNNEGRIIACDSDRKRLSELRPRSARAGVTIAESRLLDGGTESQMLGDLEAAADLVLIDAPCSGSGTWRRNPEAKWRLTPERLHRLAALQLRLLQIGARLVRPGGRLAYVVCSLLPDENEEVIASFQAAQPGWVTVPTNLPCVGPPQENLLLTPRRNGTDGFFMTQLSPI